MASTSSCTLSRFTLSEAINVCMASIFVRSFPSVSPSVVTHPFKEVSNAAIKFVTST